jgi:hypothetical protein
LLSSFSATLSTGLQRKVAISACLVTFLEWHGSLTFATITTIFNTRFLSQNNPFRCLTDGGLHHWLDIPVRNTLGIA